MDCIVALAGPAKSGKTTLGKKLAASFAVPFASFGDHVRKEARCRGIMHATHQQLQELGSEMIKDMKGFCKVVLEESGFVAGHGVIVDGVRHMAALAAIRTLVPGQSVKLIYVESGLPDRTKRSSLSARELLEIDSHPLESDKALLKSNADLVLRTSAASEECFEVLLKWTLERCN